ncbi:alpha/beta hydrolase [Erythrobacter sp. JK5]|uniref:alpha/beta hydrolase n=1 Tax=Erythrobacter sp. JK5 TaxID=2829500 RepID=UPI001BA82052|nr:alpha/beta hydrolase [Erythrobacter sp. JK5]QUL36750.1 alpha/beta hydrolase [Erythrobacter sp. JK5]
MIRIRRRSLVLAGALFLAGCVSAPALGDEAFVALADAYVSRDADAAAAQYAENATVIYAYDGAPEERAVGRDAIAASFAGFFGQIDARLPLDLNFRVTQRQGANARGFYRLRFGGRETSYGGFETEQSPDGLLVRDRSTSATIVDFEEAPGPLLVRADENDLDRDYYGLLAGRYRLPDGCDLVVTRSVVRLFLRNTCDQSWRGLNRKSGLEWTGGDQVLPASETVGFAFAPVADAPSATLRMAKDARTATATRSTPYAMEDVTFAAADGTRLAGTIYHPKNPDQRLPATVLVHGSGPQDRDGYASIIAVLADALAAQGRVVLAYDKRGSGASQGNGDAAGFDVLARDAASAMGYLRSRAEVDPKRVGLAGSSQAGWVVAKAIEQGSQPADVFLLGAAGAAFTVREQNLYNTDVRMECAGIPASAREKALAQQSAFFDAIYDRSKAPGSMS